MKNGLSLHQEPSLALYLPDSMLTAPVVPGAAISFGPLAGRRRFR